VPYCQTLAFSSSFANKKEKADFFGTKNVRFLVEYDVYVGKMLYLCGRFYSGLAK